MKKIIFLILWYLLAGNIFSQSVGINADGSSPDNSAGLDINFTDKGLLIPRIALTSETDNTTIPSPTTGLVIFNTTSSGSLSQGFYFWDGSKWRRLFDDETIKPWFRYGNSGTTPGTDFLGTTDATDFVIKTNNTERIRITDDGRVGIGGTPEDCAQLEINSTSGGLLLPRMTEAQRDAIPTPMQGLLIYNTDDDCIEAYNPYSEEWVTVKCTPPCLTSSECASITDYTVESITYAPVSGTGTSVSLGDDAVSSAIDIGFDFCFYGQSYNQVYISSNGFITFTSGQSSGCCSGVQTPNTNAPNNFIALNWTDLNPNYGGTIDYFTTGTAPNREFVVRFTNIGEYANSSYKTNAQIILYECSGNIEIHISSIDINTHTLMQGIENQDGSSGVGIPGRNTVTGPISITNEAWRFTPQY